MIANFPVWMERQIKSSFPEAGMPWEGQGWVRGVKSRVVILVQENCCISHRSGEWMWQFCATEERDMGGPFAVCLLHFISLIEWFWNISYKKLVYADKCPTPILWLLSNPCLVPACLIIGLNLLFSYSLKENIAWSCSRFFLELCTNSLCHQTGNEF